LTGCTFSETVLDRPMKLVTTKPSSMQMMWAFTLLATVAAAPKDSSMLQTWLGELGHSTASARDTPVTRVVGLLKEMQKTLETEMEEDKNLYKTLSCWCNDNNWEKSNAIEEAEAKIEELKATIERLTAKSAELNVKIAETKKEVAADKQALAEATALREKQLKEFHGGELDSIQNIENLKAAIVVLSKHFGAAFPQVHLSLLSTSAHGKRFPGESESHAARSFDTFMEQHGFDASEAPAEAAQGNQKFLQADVAEPVVPGMWSATELATVRKAVQSASAFMQARHGERYYPSYTAQSGEVMGVMKQLKEEMEGDLSEAQKIEQQRAAAFAELRAAKTKEIEEGEKMEELKEDELATTDNDLAEAKEDLGQTEAALSEDQKFMMNLKKTCAEAATNFEARSKARLAEITAVSETISILTADDARDAMKGTFSFIQLSSQHQRGNSARRHKAAALLKNIARKIKNPGMIALATSVELDAFTKVKKAIDDMISMLKIEQEDEVKKKDWCKVELQTNEMSTMKTEDLKADLEAKIAELASKIKTLAEEIDTAKQSIVQLQLNLQRATEDRKSENIDFQKTMEDQTMTIEVLHAALDKLATYYDKEFFTQVHATASSKRQTPPVPQMEYKPSEGATGVMSMIEKLIYDSKELMAKSKTSEQQAQAAYEQTIADTNTGVADLQKEVVSKTKAKAKATKDKSMSESDLADAVTELEGLAKYNADLHAECDYILKNFMVRQEGRAQEIEALQQAKQILSGASLS